MGNRQENEHSISGTVKHVGMPETITDKFSKRQLVLEVFVGSGNYPRECPIDFVNSNMSELDGVNSGDWVHIKFAISGNGKVQNDGTKRWWSSVEGISCVVDKT